MRLLLGDCRDVMRELPDNSVDCIIADPPYAETNLSWDKQAKGWLDLASRVLRPSGSLWLFGSLRSLLALHEELEGWKLAQDVVWEKHNGSSFHADRFRRVHELAAQFYKVEAAWSSVYKAPQFTNDAVARAVRKKARPAHWHGAIGPTVYVSEDGGPRLMRSVMYARSAHGSSLHPTQKPLEVVAALVRYSCPEGGTVLDPFMGSGTTGVAAVQEGRKFIGVELDEGYYATACERITRAWKESLI